MWMKTKHPTE